MTFKHKLNISKKSLAKGGRCLTPFIELCIAMMILGIGAEIIHATDGRFSMAGNLVLKFISVGMVFILR